jgi:hypothetical protein
VRGGKEWHYLANAMFMIVTKMHAVSRYLRVGYKKVEGWLQPFSARYISEVAKVQNEFCKGAGFPNSGQSSFAIACLTPIGIPALQSLAPPENRRHT